MRRVLSDSRVKIPEQSTHIANMPTSFEHSAMKSFSLSSLGAPPASTTTPATSIDRPYHSLNKKRKEAWRRSWGSAASGGSGGGGGGTAGGGGDDLWPLLQHHYDYIMDNGIIDTCREANGELSCENRGATSTEVARAPSPEFAELCRWLAEIQDEIYSSPENLSDRALRTKRLGELEAAEPRRARFAAALHSAQLSSDAETEEAVWRARHLLAKWECVRLLLDNEPARDTPAVDTAHELRCLRRWLHNMEGRLPPPSLAAARALPPAALRRRIRQHQVLQRDVECHGRIVSSVVRLCCGGEAARALERRWHLLYLRAIEWQCHLEACLARLHNQGAASPELASDSDSEPALKQPRLSPRRQLRTRTRRHLLAHIPARVPAHTHSDTDVSYSEELQDEEWCVTDCSEPELRVLADDNMASLAEQNGGEQSVPRTPTRARSNGEGADVVDGNCYDGTEDVCMYEHRTPPTVVKRRSTDSSRFNQTDRKSRHCATFYFRHHDTDSERRGTSEQERDTSEDEWTFQPGNPMTDSVETTREVSENMETSEIVELVELEKTQTELEKTHTELKISSNKVELGELPAVLSGKESRLSGDQPVSRCAEHIERLVAEAEALVQPVPPVKLQLDGKVAACRSKMSRINEWLRQSNDTTVVDNDQCAESYDASGEYTTESEVGGGSGASEPEDVTLATTRTSVAQLTPTHTSKVVMRKKRGGSASGSTRPWSVACLSQLTRGSSGASAGGSLAATPTDPEAMQAISNSESAINTLVAQTKLSKMQSSTSSVKTAVQQGHISSSTTINETCVSCYELGELKQCSLRRKRLKLRRRTPTPVSIPTTPQVTNGRGDRLVKSSSFSGRLSPQAEEKSERSAASDPPASRKHRMESTSTSGNESGVEGVGATEMADASGCSVALLRRSIERTHISGELDTRIVRTTELGLQAPSFRLGALGGRVRARLLPPPRLSLGDPGRLWELAAAAAAAAERDSDLERSLTAGTEEHSSFSEQAWDSYQEKYNSEPYSEAPDSEAARRLLEFGDDYRMYLDSQSDCCSSLSAPRDIQLNARRRQAPRHRRSPGDSSGGRKPKSLSNAEHRRSLRENIERRGPAVAESGPDVVAEARRCERDSDCEVELEAGVSALVRRSAARLRDTEALLQRDAAAPDLLRQADYSEIVSTCRQNVSCLETVLASPDVGLLSPAVLVDIRGVSARWSALRSAAARRGTLRMRRELAALRESLTDIGEPGEAPPPLHTKQHLNRRIDELKERLSRLLEKKVCMLKLAASARRALALEEEGDTPGALASELTATLAAWDDLHQRTSSEHLTLEKALLAWNEWEAGLRELSSGLRSDQDALKTLTQPDSGNREHLPAQLRQLADVLSDRKSSTCGSLSDSGISDGDSEAAALATAAATGARARRLAGLRDLARQLQAALAPGSHAIRAITKRMEQAENEVRALQESCRALVARGITELPTDLRSSDGDAGGKTGAGDPDYVPRGGWLWRVMRSAFPFQLCLVALLVAAWLLDRPRCCDLLNSFASTLTPQLRYVRGPPPV